MRDDSGFWTAPAVPARRLGPGAALVGVALRQILVSGPGVLARLDVPVIGWPDTAPAPPYALSLRRDRALIVGGPPRPEGWDADRRLAVSDATDVWTILDLDGSAAVEIFARGGELSRDLPSRGAGRILFGLDLLLCRTGPDGFRLHVPRGHTAALVGHLSAAARAFSGTA